MLVAALYSTLTNRFGVKDVALYNNYKKIYLDVVVMYEPYNGTGNTSF